MLLDLTWLFVLHTNRSFLVLGHQCVLTFTSHYEELYSHSWVISFSDPCHCCLWLAQLGLFKLINQSVILLISSTNGGRFSTKKNSLHFISIFFFISIVSQIKPLLKMTCLCSSFIPFSEKLQNLYLLFVFQGRVFWEWTLKACLLIQK